MKIDTTKQPKEIDYLTIKSNDTSLGTIEWDKEKVELHLEPEQKEGYLEGNIVRERLKGKPVLNAAVLDWLYEHQDKIPESWIGKYVYFWGTIYRNSDDRLYVRCLFWLDGAWYWHFFWLDYDFHSNFPAALRASVSSKSSKRKHLPSVSLYFDGSVCEIGGKKYKLTAV